MGRARSGNGGVLQSEWLGFTLELHADLDEIKWVGGTTGDNGRYASSNETLDAHL